jgi:hypothetical protein
VLLSSLSAVPIFGCEGVRRVTNNDASSAMSNAGLSSIVSAEKAPRAARLIALSGKKTTPSSFVSEEVLLLGDASMTALPWLTRRGVIMDTSDLALKDSAPTQTRECNARNVS